MTAAKLIPILSGTCLFVTFAITVPYIVFPALFVSYVAIGLYLIGVG